MNLQSVRIYAKSRHVALHDFTNTKQNDTVASRKDVDALMIIVLPCINGSMNTMPISKKAVERIDDPQAAYWSTQNDVTSFCQCLAANSIPS